MRQQRVVIAGLVVVGVLFALSATHRAGGGAGAVRDPGGFVTWIGRHFGGTPEAKRGDLSAPCLQGDTLTVAGGTCTLTVAGSDTGQRRVRLHTDSAVAVRAPAPGRDTVVRSDVGAGDTVSVTVGGGETGIDVICDGTRTCTLTLVTGG
ncbi:hypothetical protein [Dactylosporangium sp. CA-092794]|uniref:hypothetical protein n=1 Tax=Dactylosporangium sp. CA-092794 TaxID=3239929 RepID=UPI003D9236AC